MGTYDDFNGTFGSIDTQISEMMQYFLNIVWIRPRGISHRFEKRIISSLDTPKIALESGNWNK